MWCIMYIALAAAGAVSALDIARDLVGGTQFRLGFTQDSVNASSAVELLEKPADGSNVTYSLLRATTNQAYICEHATHPKPVEPSQPLEKSKIVDIRDVALGLLGLYDNVCLIHNDLWFSYTLCFDSRIAQFHPRDHKSIVDGLYQAESIPDKDPTTASFVLGTWSKENANNRSLIRSVDDPSGPIRDGERVFLEQTWEDGTLCDMTGQPRVTRVEYYCASADYIATIAEGLTCE